MDSQVKTQSSSDSWASVTRNSPWPYCGILTDCLVTHHIRDDQAMNWTDLVLVTGHLEGQIGWHFTLKRKVSPKIHFLCCVAYTSNKMIYDPLIWEVLEEVRRLVPDTMSTAQRALVAGCVGITSGLGLWRQCLPCSVFSPLLFCSFMYCKLHYVFR